ncbi:tail fiber domain-containing protein [Flavobacterium sp.]|uniref:tail fiber domain-containing protein n=1 Tax=Flavobacterium sp. TaxID=239 RepID=UPI002618C67C|nr:tail fiber domain-containing protein [Flavobacterium sp.]
MKNIITLLLFCFFTSIALAQAPNKMSFQSVVRDGSGNLVANSNVGIKISILQTSASGTVVFSESHTVLTNANGLATLEIGNGTNISGTIAGINWATGPYFLKVESDPTGGTSYTISGTSELLSVPYALYAANSGSLNVWNILGNSNIDDATNFIGTTNAKDVIFKRDNTRSGRIGLNNTSFGYNSLNAAATGIRNTSIGANTLPSTTTGTLNVAVGESTMFLNTTGQENSAFGVGSLYSNTTGSQNTSIGRNALTSSTTANSNTAIGYATLRNNTTGNFNTGLGRDALRLNTTGIENTASGVNSLYDNTTGEKNSAVGVQSLRKNTTGLNNTAIGYQALFENTTGSNNTAVGNTAFSTGLAYSNSTAIGASSVITASNQVRVGDVNVNSIGGQVSWTTLSDGRFKENVIENVPGLSFISKLKPVTYNVNRDLLNKFYNAKLSNNVNGGLSETTVGFIAQDVEKSAKEIGFNFSGIDKPKNETDHYGIRYSDFIPPVVKAIQEQQEEIEKLKTENENLKKRLEILENIILERK